MNDVNLEMKASAVGMVGVRGAFQSVLLNIHPSIGQLKCHSAGFAQWASLGMLALLFRSS